MCNWSMTWGYSEIVQNRRGVVQRCVVRVSHELDILIIHREGEFNPVKLRCSASMRLQSKILARR